MYLAHYAHTLPGKTEEEWEPLFTPFGDRAEQCQREICKKCEEMHPHHGHLNKVAFWTAKFALEMFPANSPESTNAHQWGYLTGLWHDLGKFSLEFQNRLKGSPLSVDHSTAGAIHSSEIKSFGSLISYLIAGHHAGLADGSNLFEERLKKEI